MSIEEKIAEKLSLSIERVIATVDLLDTGNTVPFIARYRKEATGGLDEEQLRSISDFMEKLRSLEDRRQAILRSIENQGLLTDTLREEIASVGSRTQLEDLYQPYKPKRKTRASEARKKDLQGLADLILEQATLEISLDKIAWQFLSEKVSTMEEAWAGARDIVAEIISDHPGVRGTCRQQVLKWSVLSTEKIKYSDDPRLVYQDYYDYHGGVNRLRPHQILAINRGEKEKVLRVKLMIKERDWRIGVNRYFPKDRRSVLADQLELATVDAAERLLLPAIERDARTRLTQIAEQHAIKVFSSNLRSLLLQPPLVGYIVMGIDPGFRTGSKVAVVDPTGKVLDSATIYPHPPQKEIRHAVEVLVSLIKKFGVKLIAIGNGTASRETEQMAADLISENSSLDLKYLIVSEAGASVYSASQMARTELPDLDVSMRGAVSIARRVLDPLAELVKIDPKSIGVGLYQHDVDQKELAHSLDVVVESAVNSTGVEINTASSALLAYVSGIGPKLAERIVAHRDKSGPFQNREMIKTVPGLGPKAFQQAAGFLRIRGGSNPLDGSAIHPESYTIAEKVIHKAEINMEMSVEGKRAALDNILTENSFETLSAEFESGVPTLKDIFQQLVQPGRDPREDLPLPVLRSDVLKIEDLLVGMRLRGTVRNVVDFGAFIDIGVKQDGLLHRSQVPRDTKLGVGDVVSVEILKIESERGRISLGWVVDE
jgi:uncharacterized protein